jgi:hypothetical protein
MILIFGDLILILIIYLKHFSRLIGIIGYIKTMQVYVIKKAIS